MVAPAVGFPIILLVIVNVGHTASVAPPRHIPLPAELIELLSIIKLVQVCPEALFCTFPLNADGAVVAAAVEAPAPAKITLVPDCVAVKDVFKLELKELPEPFRLQFLIVTLFAVVTSVEVAILITEVNVTVVAAEFVIVKFLLYRKYWGYHHQW